MPPKKKGTPARNKAAAKDIVDKGKKAGTAKRTNEHQEDGAKDKPKRAHTEVHIVCPTCKDRLLVKTFRNVVEPQVPAVVELETVVEKDPQARLFTNAEVPPPGAKAKVETDAKATPGGGRKKAV